MVHATNIDATAVNTIGWLSTGEWTIVVPVYQRQYRWDIGACERLLADVRTVADAAPERMHFLGSVLSSVSDGERGRDLVLIDGQQRLTTLMLLVAAVRHTMTDADAITLGGIDRVLVSAADATRTKLHPHPAWAGVFESLVLPRSDHAPEAGDSRFHDNYAFFRSQISNEEAPHIWRGLQKLEHVAITLGAGANAQQIFESLNSTGEPLRDHELIHNYILMGLSHSDQRRIEDDFWVPIERDTGESIATFWRQYLVMVTGREVALLGGRGVYDTFRQVFPRIEAADLPALATQWREYARIYRILRAPSLAPDPAIATELEGLATFGTEMYPLVMGDYAAYEAGSLSREELRERLTLLQSLLLRRTVVGIPVDRLVARLCRARDEGAAALSRAFERITPSNDRVRMALKHTPLPHPAYVLARLAGLVGSSAYGVDHIAPLAPGDSWSGDGLRSWLHLNEDEQNSLRALAPTLGNLVLLEDDLALRAMDAPFLEKRRLLAGSSVPMAQEVAATKAWGTRQISERSAHLAEQVLTTWARPWGIAIDDDGLTPILDAVRRRGWPAGWQREFAYVEYRGEHWEVPDVKYLFNRIFKRLWADDRPAVITYSREHGGPVYADRAWNGQWDSLDDEHSLYMGWDSSYMLTAVQGVLDQAGVAAEVFVKYSYIGDAMK
ncbi:DUF262 domain-containing protein [Microbacterium sp. C7(2022)]|uniref:DUF262 domain-containing protein n=1 Tax=Microbacterium sp. C7(2022) TaxID=2992759 RepID=UPI00237B8838|nr:DUF262 domain-containing protein [Microbacterium sp. C7(2022)]MDE0547038.1 DUF262 domain-containing HNH endonuclease family protein [Microbacterium sp. C7(2022)]